ncbi:hypothetical protein TNCV_3049031 [Trichonephila clavipes]|nr:hypothetical protein TNCV_3049031 [Trichonephila clavipes]
MYEYLPRLPSQYLQQIPLKLFRFYPLVHSKKYLSDSESPNFCVAAVAEWYRYRIVASLVASSSPVPPKTRRVGQRCTLNLSRAETSSR